jgi:formylglycine-generating enzyme required for sulfatase activity
MRLAGVAAMLGALCVLGSGQTTGGPPRPFTNSIGMKFVPIEPGTFRMGSDSGDASEKPAHKIILTKGFYMQVTEVTQAQW